MYFIISTKLRLFQINFIVSKIFWFFYKIIYLFDRVLKLLILRIQIFVKIIRKDLFNIICINICKSKIIYINFLNFIK